MEHPVEITISRNAVRKNLEFIKDLVGDEIRVSSVVKANAYGHGIEKFVPLVMEMGIDHFSVFSYFEAIRVHEVVNKETDIMIMGWIGKDHIADAVSKGFEFFVFDLQRLRNALKAAEHLGIAAKIHLDVETGMHRTGLNRNNFRKALTIILENKEHIIVKGMCSHLAGPESVANHVRVKNQIKVFKNFQKEILKNGIKPEYFHLACSAATVCYPSSRFNLVRVGIMQYGFWSSREVFLRYSSKQKDFTDPLERVITLKSEIMTVKKVKKGKFISYGTSFLAQSDMKIAVVPIGYSNGYSRSFSNRGRIIIAGERCSVIGLVNMNMIIVDVTNIDKVKAGDEVVLIGTQGEITISVNSFSEIGQQINYEILSRLPQDIPRKIIN